MNTATDTRRPDEIESDIARKRADVSSTIDAIQRKLTPGELMDEAMQMLRQGHAREFADNLGRAVRDNPMPVALVGVGLAWLVLGATRHRSPTAWQDELEYPAAPGVAGLAEAPSWPVGATATGGGTGTSAGAYGIGESSTASTASIDGARPGLGQRVKETVGGAAGSVRASVGGVAHGARESVTGVARRARGLGAGVRTRAGDLRERSRAQAAHARETARHWVDEQPLLVGAVGLAAGALLGAMLPPTRREDELLGRASDDWMHGARDTARESLEQVRASAGRVAQTARSEVEHAIDTVGDTNGRPGPAATP